MRIVVIGAGYAGTMCAVRLALRTKGQDASITLVNGTDRFVERLRLHQVAAGQELVSHRVPDILEGTGVAFVEGMVAGIDTGERTVTVDKAEGVRTLPYDTLVYALGSRTDTGTVPGILEHAYTLDDPRLAGGLARRLALAAEHRGTVAVCGGGLTGVEAATEIAESHPGLRVVLLSRGVPGTMLGANARRHLQAALHRLGVEVRAGVEIGKILPDAVELADGELVSAEVCLWTGGVRAPQLAGAAGLAVDERGAVLVDPWLRSVSHPEILAIGDAAAIRLPWGTVHGTCQSAIPAGAYAADSIARRLRGKEAGHFRFGYFHQPVSLGRRDAVVQFVRADETPKRWCLRGRLAVRYKETISSSPFTTYRMTKRFAAPAAMSKGGRATRRAAEVSRG